MKTATFSLSPDLGDAGVRGVNAQVGGVTYEDANLSAVLQDFPKLGVTHVRVLELQTELLGDEIIKPGVYTVASFLKLQLVKNLLLEELAERLHDEQRYEYSVGFDGDLHGYSQVVETKDQVALEITRFFNKYYRHGDVTIHVSETKLPDVATLVKPKSEHPLSLSTATNKFVFYVVYEDGAVSLNGRLFSCDTLERIEDAKNYLRGIEAEGVIYRLPGASGNLLEPDALITVGEALDCLEQLKDNL